MGITRTGILVVDDLPQNLQLVGGMLERQEYDVSYLSASDQVVQVAAESQPDLILLDIMMPGKDGLQVCKELKSDPRTSDIPVIFLTALAGSEELARGFEAGAVDYVSKPFNAAELLARVGVHAELRRSRLELDRLVADLDKANKAKDLLLREIHHRVTNNLAIVSSIIGLQAEETGDEDHRRSFEQLERRIESIALVHAQLYRGDDLSAISMDEYLGFLLKGLVGVLGDPRSETDVKVAGGGMRAGNAIAVPIGIIVTEAVTNAFKYAFAGGRRGKLDVSLCLEGGECVLLVGDDGPGLGEPPHEGKYAGLGMRLVGLLADQLHGKHAYRQGPGTILEVRFPASGMIE